VGRVQVLRQPVHLVGEQMPVQVQGHLDAGVAQVGLDGLGMSSLSDEQRGAGVPEIVDPEVPWEARGGDRRQPSTGGSSSSVAVPLSTDEPR
jgi:hypothetical protein